MRDPNYASLGATPDDPRYWGDHEVENKSWQESTGTSNGEDVTLGDVYGTINKGRTARKRKKA